MSKYNKRARSSSPDNYKEQYTECLNLILNDSSDILMCNKENELKNNTDLEIKQINAVRYFFIAKFLYYSIIF